MAPVFSSELRILIARYARGLVDYRASSRRRAGPALRPGLWLSLNPTLRVRSYPAAHNRRNCMLEDQLLLRIVLKQHGVFIEGPYLARKFHATYQIDSNGA